MLPEQTYIKIMLWKHYYMPNMSHHHDIEVAE